MILDRGLKSSGSCFGDVTLGKRISDGPHLHDIERLLGPVSGEQDTTITVRPRGPGVYELSPNPFAAHSGEYAFAGRPIEPGQHEKNGGWSSVLAKAPTVWERFRLVTA